jgi:membrane associated rhomboid family serine protease
MFQTRNTPIDTRSIVFNIIAINVLMFIATFAVGEGLMSKLSLHYLFNTHDYIKNAGEAGVSGFQPIQLFTHMFMHANVPHLFFNMFAAYMFGSVLERVWGGKRFLVFYLVTGFGAVILHMLVQFFLVWKATGSVDPIWPHLVANPEAFSTYFSRTVGASGAVFGILVGFGMMFPNTELMLLFFPIPIKAKYFISFYVLMELYLGFNMSQGDNIAHFAHLGGALFGFILIKIWSKNRNFLF